MKEDVLLQLKMKESSLPREMKAMRMERMSAGNRDNHGIVSVGRGCWLNQGRKGGGTGYI